MILVRAACSFPCSSPCSSLQLALPRPDGALLLGASLRFTRSSLILPATSDDATTLSLNSPFSIHTVSFCNTRLPSSRDSGNGYSSYLSRHACSRFDLTHKCCSTRPVTLTRTLESPMEPARGTALSILTSIGSDMHECRLACQTHVHAPYILVSWAPIEPIQTFHLVSPNTRADFAANHH